MNISILLADDHPILLKGLVQEFETNGYTRVVTAKNGAEALQIIHDTNPIIAILDMEMPMLSGFEVIQKAREVGTTTKFIILTYHKEQGFVVQAKKMKIDGYLVKDDTFNEIENCIKSVLLNKFYVSSSFHKNIIEDVDKQVELLNHLTPSERTIIRMISQKLNSTQIAEQLRVSPRTIQKHRTNIIAKLNLEASKDSLSIWTDSHKELVLTL